MAALTDIQVAPMMLSLLFGNDSKQSLIQAIAWFDPMSLNESQTADDNFDAYAEDEIMVGMYICRACFPAIYAGANALLMQNRSEREIERYLCEGISAHLVTSVDSLEEARYGPPLECYGIDATLLSEGDEPSHPMHRVTALFELFGISLNRTSQESTWSQAGTAALVLRLSLENHSGQIYQDLFLLLAWLFSASGNSLVDWSQDEMWESGVEMFCWTPEDIAFVNEMTREAQDIMASVWRGLTTLEQDTALHEAFICNLKSVYSQLARKGKKSDARTHFTDAECAALARRVKWPERNDNGITNQADHDAGVLSVRDHPAPPTG